VTWPRHLKSLSFRMLLVLTTVKLRYGLRIASNCIKSVLNSFRINHLIKKRSRLLKWYQDVSPSFPPCVRPPVRLPACPPARLPARLPACPPACLPACPPACLPVCLSLCLSVCLSVCPRVSTAPTWPIYMKSEIGYFYENLTKKCQICLKPK
jgi:hypothetical protein